MNAARRASGASPAQRLRSRSVFALSLLLFLVVGIVWVGDFWAQWWVLLVPVGLLVGPVLALRRGAGRHPRGDQQTTPWS